MKLELDEKSIDNIVKYAKEHPQEIRDLLELFADEILAVLMKQDVLERGAQLYKMIKKKITQAPVTLHKCPVCRAHPLKKVKGKLYCPECEWREE